MGSVLAELFSCLHGGKDGPLPEKSGQEQLSKFSKAMATLETVLTKWQTDVGRDYPYRFRRANELAANMIFSIPPAEALRCGFAPWFVKLTKRNILDSTTSSTAVFLKMQMDRYSPEALCVEFMNVLCAVSHCGHTPETVILMFHACLQVLEEDSNNLGPSFENGVQLCQVLSLLAKAKSFWTGPGAQRGKEYYLRELLEKAFERHKGMLADNESVAAEVLEQTCEGQHLRFYPVQGLAREERRWISHFETRLLELAAPKIGCSMRSPWEKPAWNSTFLKGFLRAKTETEHFYSRYSPGFYVLLAGRRRLVDQWLRGVVTVLQQDSIPVYSGRVLRACVSKLVALSWIHQFSL